MRTPASRKPFTVSLFTAAVAALALLVTGCSDTGESAEAGTVGSSTTARDTIVVVTPDQASNVVRDYGYTAGTDNQDVTNNLHAQLIRKPYVEEAGANVKAQDLYSFEPYLAESYTVSEDGLIYTFNLRHGVLSQQGNELTADDVIFSFERKFNTKGGGMAGYYKPMITDPVSQIAKVDQYTVTFTVAQAGYGFTLLGNLAENIGSIYDSTYLKANATAEDPYAVAWGVEDIMRGNAGFGPYMLDSVTPNQEIVMVANPNFVLGELPVKTIIRRVVPDAATRANTLLSGDADIALDLRPSDQASFASNPDIFTPVATTNLYHNLTLNTTKAPFDNLEVRQAVAFAIPYQQIIDDVYQGRAYIYQHLLDDKAPFYDATTLPEYTFDPAKAKQMLADAGYPDGIEFTLTVTNVSPSVQDTAVVLAAAAKEAGITINIQEVPAAQSFTDGLAGKLEASMGTGSAVTMSPPYELQLITQPGGGSNTGFWSGPGYDAYARVLDEGLNAGDAIGAAAAAKWSEAEGMLMENASSIFIARVMSPFSFRADVTGYTQRTDRRIDYSALTIG